VHPLKFSLTRSEVSQQKREVRLDLVDAKTGHAQRNLDELVKIAGDKAFFDFHAFEVPVLRRESCFRRRQSRRRFV
jgi:hypothetical protein